jgi:uncharacterized protein (TIGR00255 family)
MEWEMPSSMTGFASAEVGVDPYRIVWEVRSVNHRFLDLSFRLPEELRALEPRCRELLGAALRRGKVDCTLRVTLSAGPARDLAIKEDVIDGLRALEAQLQQRFPQARGLSVGELLRWPGVVEEATEGLACVEPAAIEGLEAALRSLQGARRREGERLAELLVQRCEGVVAIVENCRALLPQTQERYRAKLMERLGKLDLETNPERLEQELVLLAQRLDVAEELDRLGGHVEEVKNVLRRNEAVGRRLDFIVQELNREANTVSSKVQDEELTRAAVELKVLIEQMREQVQNLE